VVKSVYPVVVLQEIQLDRRQLFLFFFLWIQILMYFNNFNFAVSQELCLKLLCQMDKS